MELRNRLSRLFRPRWTRAAKATCRFLLLIGGLVSFAMGFARSYPDEVSWVNLGLFLVCVAALFYDPENPPNADHPPIDLAEDDDGDTA